MTQALGAELERIVRADPDLMAILPVIGNLPDVRLVSGCIYQTVWNVLTKRPRGYGIKDYDIAYFDAGDLSWEAEDRVIVQVRDRLPKLADRLEIHNQARVHLWFAKRFGMAYAPLKNTNESIDRYAAMTHMVGVRLCPWGELDVYAPGLADIFAMRLRPNRLLDNRATYETKALRMAAAWPELTVEAW